MIHAHTTQEDKNTLIYGIRKSVDRTKERSGGLTWRKMSTQKDTKKAILTNRVINATAKAVAHKAPTEWTFIEYLAINYSI